MYLVHFGSVPYLSRPLLVYFLSRVPFYVFHWLVACHDFLAWNAVIIVLVVLKLMLGSFGFARPPLAFQRRSTLLSQGAEGACGAAVTSLAAK